MSAIRIQVVDEYHNLASYAQLLIKSLLRLSQSKLVGPKTRNTEGSDWYIY